MDPFWFPPEEFGPPQDLGEIATELRTICEALERVSNACHAVRPRVNMRPTVRKLYGMRASLAWIARVLVAAQHVLEDDAPLASDFPGSDQAPWWARENPLLSPDQLRVLHDLTVPGARSDGLLYVGQPLHYGEILRNTEAEPQHIVDHHRQITQSIESVILEAEELVHPALGYQCPHCNAEPGHRCHTPSGSATRTHQVRIRLAPPVSAEQST